MKNSSKLPQIGLIFLENLKINQQLLSTVTLAEILKFNKKKDSNYIFFFKLAIILFIE